MSSDPIVQVLQVFSSCDVSDALLKLNHPYGGFLSNLTLWSPARQEGNTKIIGPAYTVKYVRKNHGTDPEPRGHYIDSVPAGAVVFISAPPRIVNALYGGLMSTRAQYSRAVGTIVDGRIRDLQEHRDLGYPVFARDIGTTSPSEIVRVNEINVPVRLNSEDQEITIHPKGLAEKAVELMASQVAADEQIARDIKRGRSFAEASKEHRASVKKP